MSPRVSTAFRNVLVTGLIMAGGCGRDRPTTHLERVRALKPDSFDLHGVLVYYSKGREARARRLAAFVEGMRAFYASGYGWNITPKLAILGEADWRATLENPYGVPAMRQPGSVAFMPADVEAGVVYHDFVDLREKMPSGLQDQLVVKCGSFERCAAEGADAIIAHELGHMYQTPAGIGSPAYWFNEFVADYFAYAYLSDRQPPQAWPYMFINRLTAAETPQFQTLDEFERRIEEALPRELARVHGVFYERVQQVYDRQGLGFAVKLAGAFPRARYPFGCDPALDGARAGASAPMARSWTGLCDSSRVPTDEILRRLEAIEPGFVEWASSFGMSRQ